MGAMSVSPHAAVRKHLCKTWGPPVAEITWDSGPVDDLPSGFHILSFTKRGELTTYCTCGLSGSGEEPALELFMVAPSGLAPEDTVELLVAVAHFHCTSTKLSVGHIVNFGRGWTDESECDHGILILPYLDGPSLEWTSDRKLRVLWLLPVTNSEREYAKLYGREVLEQEFDKPNFRYWDPRRPSTM